MDALRKSIGGETEAEPEVPAKKKPAKGITLVKSDKAEKPAPKPAKAAKRKSA